MRKHQGNIFIIKKFCINFSVLYNLSLKGWCAMNLDKIVCNCLSVTNGMIKDAVDAGASTLEEVQDATGAGTVCGACLDDVQHLVDFFVSERDK